MDHYVAYHSVDLMNQDYGDGGEDFGHYSRKPESVLRKTIGKLVWVVVGERGDKRTEYRLAGVYSPDQLVHEDEEWVVRGRGVRAPARTDITDLPWFAELFREQNRFSLGMNRIRSARVIEALTTLIPQCTSLSSGSAAVTTESSFTHDEVFPIIASLIAGCPFERARGEGGGPRGDCAAHAEAQRTTWRVAYPLAIRRHARNVRRRRRSLPRPPPS
jgi:hypothetical protein